MIDQQKNKKNAIVYFYFFVVIGIVLLKYIHGIGNFWDWSFPYFKDQISNTFGINSLSWISSNLGSPLGYASNYYLFSPFLLLRFLPLNPETWRYLSLVSIFSLIVYFVFTIKDHKKSIFSLVLLSLAVIFNPAFFSKVLAGHFSYFVSLAIFIYLISLCIKNKNNNSISLVQTLVIAILLSIVGFQIQFFVFAATFLVVYFLFNKEKFPWKYCWVFIIVPLLVNLPWLSNYLIGVNSIGASSQTATQMLFADAAFASPMRIFFMIFAPATNIQFVYDRWMLIYFGLFTFITYGSIAYYYLSRIKSKRVENNRTVNVIVTNLIIFTVFGTGYFQKMNVPFLKLFYPMFRESGHFAPVIILFEILSLIYILPIIFTSIGVRHRKIGSALAGLVLIYLVGFVSINIYSFEKYLPIVDFSAARAQFQPFEDFGNSDTSTYRVLTYPFWNQYSFNSVPSVEKKDRLLNSSGWDSFIEFSGKDHINNYQPGGESINDTLQYRLLSTDSLIELKQKNVKYIYDMQNIYTSNYERYTTPDTYDHNLSLIKNDPKFIDKLMASNPGEITKVADHIYRINNTLPRVYAEKTDGVATPEVSFVQINQTEYSVTIKNLSGTAKLNFLEGFHPGWKLYLGDHGFLLKPVFDSTHAKVLGYANSWTISKNDAIDIAKNQNKNVDVNPDGSINIRLSLYFQPQRAFSVALVLSVVAILSICGYLLYAVKSKK